MNQRSPIAQTLLSLFVPLYILYWLYVTADDLRKRGAAPPPLKLLFFPLLGLLLLIPLSIAGTLGVDGGSGAQAIVALLIVAFVIASVALSLYYYYKFSAAAEKATGSKISTVVGFLLFLFVSPAAVYVIQDALNSQTAAKT